MTERETAIQNKYLLDAWYAGKTLQFKSHDGEWLDQEHNSFPPIWTSISKYRVKPSEPTYREWSEKDVIAGMVLTNITACRYNITYIVVQSDSKGLYISGRMQCIDWIELLKYWKVTYDKGITWHPCGIKE